MKRGQRENTAKDDEQAGRFVVVAGGGTLYTFARWAAFSPNEYTGRPQDSATRQRKSISVGEWNELNGNGRHLNDLER